MMEDKLRGYLARQAMKKAMQNKKAISQSGGTASAANTADAEVSEALKRKDREREAAAASRRRVRGGAPAPATSRDTRRAEALLEAISKQDEMIAAYVIFPQSFRLFLTSFLSALPEFMLEMPDPIALLTLDDDFNTEYGMLPPEQTVLIRAYSDDSDDTVLSEIQPRYVIMYEPNLEFVRRLEVCRSLPLPRFSISLDSVF